MFIFKITSSQSLLIQASHSGKILELKKKISTILSDWSSIPCPFLWLSGVSVGQSMSVLPTKPPIVDYFLCHSWDLTSSASILSSYHFFQIRYSCPWIPEAYFLCTGRLRRYQIQKYGLELGEDLLFGIRNLKWRNYCSCQCLSAPSTTSMPSRNLPKLT